MNRDTLIALAVFVALLAAGYFVMKRPGKGERTGKRPVILAKMTAKTINKLTVTAKGKTVVLQRHGKDQWKVTSPVNYPADKYTVDTAAEKLEKLEFGDLITKQKARQAEYEVDDKAGIRVIASDGKKTLADFYLGKLLNDHTMFRLAGKDEIYQVVGSQRYAFEREVKNWRKREITEFKQDQPRKLELTTAGGAISLSRKDDKASWKVDKSDTEIKQLDSGAVDAVLRAMQSLTAFKFADGKKPQEVGLDKPTATIKVTLADKKSQTLLVGSHKGDEYWVKRAGKPQVFVIQKSTAKDLLKRPIDFRDKTVLTFKGDAVVSMVITRQEKDKEAQILKLERKGKEWMGNDKKVKDDQKIKDAIKELSSLKAEGFSRHAATELGLDKPSCAVELKLKDGTSHHISVGSVEKDGAYGLTSKQKPADIFSFQKYSTDRFCLDPKDYK